MGRFAAGVFFAFIDLVRALPSTLMALLVIVGLGSGQWQLMAATGIAFSPLVAYVARSVYQREASREYVLAARSFGGSRMHILKLHLFPNIMGALITQLGIVLPRCIVTESVLSFLGLGSSPDEPTWGRMIADAAPMMERAPHEVIVPLCALVLLTFSLSLLANEWRERLDPIRRLERCGGFIMHKLWLLASTVGKGLLQCVLIVALTFLFCRTIPGDAVDVLGLEGGLTAEQAAAIRQALKLDDPWLVQFGDWLSAASRGDLGQSLRFGRSVSDMLLNAIPVTLQLAGWAFVLGLFLALGLSLWAAARQSAFADSLVEGLNAWSIAMPTFCAGVIFILLFCIELHWLPVIGSFVLPAVIMGLDSGGTIVKPLREELKESAALPYVRTAKAKGLAPLRIAVFHILPNAAGILLSLSGLVAGSLVAGTLTMEILFGLPGIGSLALNAIQGRDTPVVLAAVSFIAVSLVLINTVVDALHKLFDPRMTP